MVQKNIPEAMLLMLNFNYNETLKLIRAKRAQIGICRWTHKLRETQGEDVCANASEHTRGKSQIYSPKVKPKIANNLTQFCVKQ